MRVAITGASGVVGRNLVFEFIKQHMGKLGWLELVLLGRPNGHGSFRERMRDVILDDGLAYVSGGRDARRELERYCAEGVRYVEMDLESEGLGLSRAEVARLKAAPVDFFFHSAALTDLRTSRVAEQALTRTNVRGTRRVLDLVSALDVGEFCYVGSAYCCGAQTGRILPDYARLDGGFRNPYEESKMRAEIEVRRFAERTGIRCRYFRPSIVCGRLTEPPLGSISRFGVFYSIAAFIVRLKAAMLPDGADVYTEPVRIDLRVCRNPHGGLNIVPVDYAAKVMYQVCMQGDPGDSYHVVNGRQVPNDLFGSLILGGLNVTGLQMVDHVPTNKTRLESLYYKTVGGLFTSYATTDSMLFDTGSVQRVLRRAGLQCPPIDGGSFRLLMDYARGRDFGLRSGRLRAGATWAAA